MAAQPKDTFPPHRVEAFSDGVLAIVITLLVLELKVPHLASPDSVSEAWNALVEGAPKLVSFLLSFSFIAVYWIGHHRFFALVERVDWGLLWLNNLLLLLLSTIPFPTAFAGDYPANPVALAVLALLLMAAGVTFNLMWRHVRREELLKPEVAPAFVNRIIGRGLRGPAAYVFAGLAGFIAPPVSWIVFTLVPVYYALPPRRRPQPPPPPEPDEADETDAADDSMTASGSQA